MVEMGSGIPISLFSNVKTLKLTCLQNCDGLLVSRHNWLSKQFRSLENMFSTLAMGRHPGNRISIPRWSYRQKIRPTCDPHMISLDMDELHDLLRPLVRGLICSRFSRGDAL